MPKRLLLAAAMGLLSGGALAQDQIGLAAKGRFDLLEQQLEAKAGPLDSRDRHALCYAYSKTKRYAKLLDCLAEWERVLKGKDRRTRLFALDDGTGALHLMRAETLLELGQFDAAIASAQAALAWLKQEDSEDLDIQVNVLATLGIAQQAKGERDKAAATRQQLATVPAGWTSPYRSDKAMALARLNMAIGDHAGVLKALEGDKLFGAEVFLDRLLTGGYFTGDDNWIWVTLPRLFMIAKALRSSGRSADAARAFDKLLQLPETRQNGDVYWLALDEAAQIAQQGGDGARALGLYRQAIDVVERQRATIQSELNKIGYFADKQDLYARAITLAVGSRQSELAFELVERAKARALLDLLAGRSIAARTERASGAAGPLGDYLALDEQRFAQLPLASTRAAAQTAAGAPAAPLAAGFAPVDAPRLSLAQLRQQIGKDECLVEYFSHHGELVVVAVTHDDVAAVRLAAPDLEARVRALRQAVQARAADTPALARALYELILAPVRRQIGARDLLIVPHGPMHYLPFAALRDDAGWLVASRSLRFLPSSSSQPYLRQPAAGDSRPILILGNPDLGDPELDLPGAAEEAAAVAAIMQPARTVARLAASETLLKAEGQDYRHIHIAAHGQYNDAQPMLSRLALAKDGGNDGDLTAAEVFGLRLNADLVTLSACETGLGKTLQGDEVIGLQRAFLFAGASNILASLWEVDDQATNVLMQRFYRELRAGAPLRQALRTAQRDVMARMPEPLYWAAFQVTGLGR
jgi:CHAT domain-containing protein